MSVLVGVLLVGLVSCASSPGGSRNNTEGSGGGDAADGRHTVEDIEPDIWEFFDRWEQAVREQDAEVFDSLFWPDAILDYRDEKGWRTELHGSDAIREFRLNYFHELGPHQSYALPEPSLIEIHSENGKSFRFNFDDRRIFEWLHLDRNNGYWKISVLEIVLPTPGTFVTNRIQALGDTDGDGFLQQPELEILFPMVWELFSGPHPVATEVDYIFDENRDGQIDQGEIRYAGDALVHDGFAWFAGFRPGWAKNLFDMNGDEEVDSDEVDAVAELVLSPDAWSQEERAKTDFEHWLDEDGDGQVTPMEYRDKRGYLVWHLMMVPIPDAVFQPVPREVSNHIDEIADGNGDGRIDQGEQEAMFQALTVHHDAANYIDFAIDLQRDGKVQGSDVHLALQASATGRTIESNMAAPPYSVITAYDALLDATGDGVVDRQEIDAVVALFAGDTQAAGDVSRELLRLVDTNRDGRIADQEVRAAAGSILFPHPAKATSSLDLDADRNGDGFIDPTELGIPAGITDKGQGPTFSERIALVRGRSGTQTAAGEATAGQPNPGSTGRQPSGVRTTESGQSVYYRQLGRIQDKKLAVISMEAQTELIDEETAMSIIVFVENAFVNVGQVRVVDRNHIEEVLREYEFQVSAMVDEDTAIEIGKLSGAEIIVVGSINRVGETFYLNIKLIEVQTGEIIGSNIASADAGSEFLEMCNEAVYMLF